MLKKLFNDVLTNADNISFSSKKVAGFVCLGVTHLYAILGTYLGKVDHEIMFTLSGLTATFFGLTSIDNHTFIAKSPDTPTNNP